MSTLSFQDYVRERMLKRRDAAIKAEAAATQATTPAPEPELSPLQARLSGRPLPTATPTQQLREPPLLRDEVRTNAAPAADIHVPSLADAAAEQGRAARRSAEAEAAAVRR